MDSESGFFRLGLFVLLGVALLVGGVVFFGSRESADAVIANTVTVDSVEGLSVGAPVKFRGVQIGQVRKIELAYMVYTQQVVSMGKDLGNAVVLELAINRVSLPGKEATTRAENLKRAVENGLRVRITSSGLTGPPYVELVFVDPATSPPLDLPWQTSGLYVPSTGGTFAKFADAAQQIIDSIRRADLEKVIKHADNLLVNSNQAVTDLDVPMLRQRAVSLIDEVRNSNKQLQSILSDPAIKMALANLSDASGSLKQTINGPDVKTFLGDLPQISRNLKAITDKLEELIASNRLNNTLDGLSKTTTNATEALADVRRLVRNVNMLLGTEQQNIQDIVRNLRDMLENTTALTGDAKMNPSRLIFGAPPTKTTFGEQP